MPTTLTVWRDLLGRPLGVPLEHLDLLVRRGPCRQRLEVEQHGEDFLGRCLDGDLAGLGDGHVRTIARERDFETIPC